MLAVATGLTYPDEMETGAKVDVVVGLQRGDEGKGRFVDMLAPDYDVVARFNGGDNAGHTVVTPDGIELKLHLIPSGITHHGIMNVIGNGTLVNPMSLAREIEKVRSAGVDVGTENLTVSSGAHLILPHHIYEDAIREAGEGRQGSTKSGISPAAASKAMREGTRVESISNETDALFKKVYSGLLLQREERFRLGINLLDGEEEINEETLANRYIEKALEISDYATDTTVYLYHRMQEKGLRILAEAAQAFLLDPDHGMHPYTTSTSTTSGGVTNGLGIPPRIDKVIGVMKATQSHVGGGPFVTEITDQVLLDRMHGDRTAIDAEYGTKTGRQRRLGYLDLVGARRAIFTNGVTSLGVTKVDWVPRYGHEVPICVAYERKGKRIPLAPDSARKLEQCTPIYEMLPTWDQDIQNVRDFNKLPDNAKRYIDFIIEQTGVEIQFIGVGPRRDQVIIL